MSAGGRSRSAALALLAGVVMIGGAAIVVPTALYWSKKGAIIRDARLKVLRAEARDKAREKLITSQASWDAFAISDLSGFSRDESGTAAIAEATNRVKSAFSALGGSASAVEGEASESGREGVQQIELEVRGTVSREKLSDLLAALESTTPYIIVEQFDAKADTGKNLRVSLRGKIYRLSEGKP